MSRAEHEFLGEPRGAREAQGIEALGSEREELPHESTCLFERFVELNHHDAGFRADVGERVHESRRQVRQVAAVLHVAQDVADARRREDEPGGLAPVGVGIDGEQGARPRCSGRGGQLGAPEPRWSWAGCRDAVQTSAWERGPDSWVWSHALMHSEQQYLPSLLRASSPEGSAVAPRRRSST